MSKFMKVAGLALTMMLLPAVAEAQLTLGGRLGYSIPGGSMFQGQTMASFTSAQVPLEFDLGYRFTPNFGLSIYVAYAPGTVGSFVKDGCASFGSTCTTYGLDYGIAAAWNFAPKAGMQPWIGVRLGNEALYIDEKNGGATSTLSAKAFAYGLEGGLDFSLGAITLGPYAAYNMSKFSKLEVTGSGTADIPSAQQTNHNWFTLGAKLGINF